MIDLSGWCNLCTTFIHFNCQFSLVSLRLTKTLKVYPILIPINALTVPITIFTIHMYDSLNEDDILNVSLGYATINSITAALKCLHLLCTASKREIKQIKYKLSDLLRYWISDGVGLVNGNRDCADAVHPVLNLDVDDRISMNHESMKSLD